MIVNRELLDKLPYVDYLKTDFLATFYRESFTNSFGKYISRNHITKWEGKIGEVSLYGLLKNEHLWQVEYLPFKIEFFARSGFKSYYFRVKNKNIILDIIDKVKYNWKIHFENINNKILYTFVIWEMMEREIGARPRWEDLKIIIWLKRRFKR